MISISFEGSKNGKKVRQKLEREMKFSQKKVFQCALKDNELRLELKMETNELEKIEDIILRWDEVNSIETKKVKSK